MNHSSPPPSPRLPIVAFVLAVLLGPIAAFAGVPAEAPNVARTVRPLEALTAKPAGERTRRLLQAYHDSILEWASVLEKNIVPVPGHPEWGYYGLPGNTEDHIRPITYAVQVNAFVAAIDPPAGPLPAARRERALRDAVAALRYLTHSHVTGGGQCVNGQPWGNAWQSAMWSRSVGLGGWLIWGQLDPSLREAVARLVQFEADRFLERPPRNQEFSNTGAEENAWDAMICSLATNMMPGHAHAAAWGQRAKLYLYNSLSRRADQANPALGDDQRPIREWVTTVNAHPDFTIENHGLVHVGYLKLTAGEMLENTVHYLLAGNAVPQACRHNIDGAYRILLRCMSWDGAPIAFGGNDWKIIHTQCTDIVVPALLGLLTDDPTSAYLEQVSLDTVRAIQKEEGGFYNVRRDLEYGGFCATRLMACFLAHARIPRETKPASAEAFNRQASGTLFLETGAAILHRTPTKFASFTWGPNRMALALPQDGTWIVWPHYGSYLGEINGQTPSRANAKVEIVRQTVGANSFDVRGRMIRAKGSVRHDFAYASLAKDVTLYIERLRTDGLGRVTSRETGIVGHTYSLGENERVLYGRHGRTRVVGLGGGDAITTMATDWLNVGDRIGYVVRRPGGRTNVMRYHGEERGTGRVPLLQEYFSLVGDEAAWSGEDWACVVTFLNQASADTAKWAGQVAFEVRGDVARCQIGADSFQVDFNTMTSELLEPPAGKSGR